MLRSLSSAPRINACGPWHCDLYTFGSLFVLLHLQEWIMMRSTLICMGNGTRSARSTLQRRMTTFSPLPGLPPASAPLLSAAALSASAPLPSLEETAPPSSAPPALPSPHAVRVPTKSAEVAAPLPDKAPGPRSTTLSTQRNTDTHAAPLHNYFDRIHAATGGLDVAKSTDADSARALVSHAMHQRLRSAPTRREQVLFAKRDVHLVVARVLADWRMRNGQQPAGQREKPRLSARVDPLSPTNATTAADDDVFEAFVEF